MSPFWSIAKAIRDTHGDAFTERIYKEWVDKVDDADAQAYYAYQHWVQIYHKDVYKKALAYARVMGWI